MGHPVTQHVLFGTPLVAERQADINVRLYVPPYSMPNSLLNQNWKFQKTSIYPLCWYNDGSFESVLKSSAVGGKNSFLSSCDVVTVGPVSYGETAINNDVGFVTSDVGVILYGDQLACLQQFFVSSTTMDVRGATFTLLPGITLNKNASLTTIQVLNSNQKYPPPGFGLIGTNSFALLSGRFCNMNYLGKVVNVYQWGPGSGYNDFIFFPLFGNQSTYLYGWNADTFDSPYFIQNAIPIKPLQLGLTSMILNLSGTLTTKYITQYDISTQSHPVLRQLTFDDPAITTLICTNQNFQDFPVPQATEFGYLFVPKTKGVLGDTPLSCILLSIDGTRYAKINFFSDDSTINAKINANWSGTTVPAITLDPNGIFYVKPADTINSWDILYNSFALNLNISPTVFDVSQLSPISLPEFCGCQPIVNGVSF